MITDADRLERETWNEYVNQIEEAAMEDYEVVIEVTMKKTVTVHAYDEDEAISYAELQYDIGEIVLDDNDIDEVDIFIED